jgi:hypothetical protein
MRRNVECASIDSILVFDEGSDSLPRGNAKVVVRSVTGRPTYADYFAWINEVAAPDDVSIVANADIYYDRQLELLKRWAFPANVALALSRWETTDDGRFLLRDHNDSQDTWIFRGRVRDVRANFPVGVPRCDNRIVSELRRAGYVVTNPSFTLRSHHVHAGDRESYGEGHLPGYVEPPYEYVWPTNLWSMPKTFLYNARHPGERLGWRVDRRRWSARLKLHWLSKGVSMLRGVSQ